jgi:hypothetical protein
VLGAVRAGCVPGEKSVPSRFTYRGLTLRLRGVGNKVKSQTLLTGNPFQRAEIPHPNRPAHNGSIIEPGQ